MRRRIALVATPVAALAALAGSCRTASAAQPRRLSRAAADLRRLTVRHAATGEKFSGPYHDGRTADPAAMAALSAVLADHRAGAARPFDPATIDILWELGRREGVSDFVILSGYRTYVTNTLVGGAGDSQHMLAKALDVQLPATRLAPFGEAALALARGGVGIYPTHGFVHIDSGPVRNWGDMTHTGAAGGRRPPQDRIGRIADAWAAARPR